MLNWNSIFLFFFSNEKSDISFHLFQRDEEKINEKTNIRLVLFDSACH